MVRFRLWPQDMVVSFAELDPSQLLLHFSRLQMCYCWVFSRSNHSCAVMSIERSRCSHADLSITCMSRHKLTLRWSVSEHVERARVEPCNRPKACPAKPRTTTSAVRSGPIAERGLSGDAVFPMICQIEDNTAGSRRSGTWQAGLRAQSCREPAGG